MTHLYAVVPVTDQAAALAWYTTFFGRSADEVVGNEAMWEISETAWLVVDERAQRAGHAVITLGVQGLDDVLTRVAARGVSHDPVEVYENGVRHVVVCDPDGNELSLAEAPSD